MTKDDKFLHAYNKDWSECADAQIDSSLRWAHMCESMRFHVAANKQSPGLQ